MSDVRDVVENIFAGKRAAFYDVCSYAEVDINRALRQRVRHFAERGISDRRAEFGNQIFVVGDYHVESFVLVQSVVVDVDGDGDDCGERSQNSRQARLAILIDASDDVTDVRQFDAVAGESAYRTDNGGISHEVIDVARMSEGMSEGENSVAVDGGDCARRAEQKISVDNGDTECRTGLKRGVECDTAFRRQRHCPQVNRIERREFSLQISRAVHFETVQ